MMTVLMSFQREVWTMTAITCVLVTVIYFAAAALDTHRPGPTGCDLGLEIYRMFIGAPTNRIFAYSCRRILTSFCLFFTLVILNAFQGSLVTFLSTPMHYPDVNTFTDLKQSNLPIRTSSISFKEILTGDPNLKSLAYRVEKWEKEEDIHNSDGKFAGFERVNVFNLEHFKDVLFIANRNNTRVLHTMNECLISYFISYVVHRNSPYKRRINILLSWIDQAGLVLKWNSDVSKYIFNKYKPINPKDYDTSKVFSVRDLEIAFIVLSFGIILSITVFIIEIMMMYIAPKMRTPHPRHLPFLH
ncbi:uncharacterized protein LOC132923000 isoform X1 [Rhopalosiphum padi]|uniref:uncharacterized protein LOC132923000 isoform X1 n=1 Tax=Rhopalosiphum padi TaxID=40932 RepID=UPI00298DD497|nr:uncharacterized protein LOC132923000 isoform X1 [Rhopalosiphum padi]